MVVTPRSSVPGIAWPALPDPRTAMLLALGWQLEQSQWWSEAELRAHQRDQLAGLLMHAATTVPAYRGLDPRAWDRVPILERDALIAAGDAMLSKGYPAAHGSVDEVMTSRTSGAPVRVRASGIVSTFWHALTLREHQWHRRDLRAHLAVIRHVDTPAPAPDGLRLRGWGAATAALAPDAPLSVLSVTTTTDEQLAWLAHVAPDYLLVYPSVLDAILRRMAATGARLPSLRGVRTISEVLSPETRALCTEVLGLPIVDTYSAQEVGYVALQCPDHLHYHVQSERLLVEILDERGAPCAVGETGRVVITDLHNFATPLLRYAIGDYATVGAPCPCGRGLPVLTRIIGRRRNMLTYPDGRTVWPVFTVACRQAARYREIQLVQPTRDSLRLRIVPDGALAPDAPAALTAALQRVFDHPFAIAIEIVDALARSPVGKLEEFVSLV